jgi:diguanylate cyclase (GGDEF)-like protein
VSILTMIGANALFVHDALDLPGQDPRLGAALRAVTLATAVALAALLSGLLELRYAALLANALGPLPTVLGTVAAIRSRRRGNRAAPLLIAGWSVVLLGTLAMVFLQRGWLPLNFWSDHALQLAMTIEIVLWMFVLAMRVKEVRASDMASRRENALLHTLAFNDPLTGLLNRRGLYRALELCLPPAQSTNSVILYLLDLDGFKAVNDRLGHDAGDAVLIEVSRRLKGEMREVDHVARLGGDEFVVVAHRLGGDADALNVGKRMLTVIGQPIPVLDAIAHVGVTIGYAIAPGDATDAATLLRYADQAMYTGKQAGRNQVLRGHVPTHAALTSAR